MHEQLLADAARMSDEALLARMELLAGRSREVTVELIAHLVEVARRGIHRAEGPGKLFGYLTRVLHFSEAAAWNRIQAARAVRRFPVVLDRLADGSVNLTSVRLLGPHLTKQNHLALLTEAAGKNKNDIKKIVARLAPHEDAPSSIRRLPALTVVNAHGGPHVGVVSYATAECAVTGGANTAARAESSPADSRPTLEPESRRPVIEPLAPQRYRLQLTMDQKSHDDLRALQDLMRREIADGDPAAIVARALELLREQAEKRAFAATANPRPQPKPTADSRHIPSAVRRAVWNRDGGRCAFVAANGSRCDERSYLEYHHVAPYVGGGESTFENIALRCRAHNAYEAEVAFGRYDDRVREAEALRSAETLFRNKSGSAFTPA